MSEKPTENKPGESEEQPKQKKISLKKATELGSERIKEQAEEFKTKNENHPFKNMDISYFKMYDEEDRKTFEEFKHALNHENYIKAEEILEKHKLKLKTKNSWLDDFCDTIRGNEGEVFWGDEKDRKNNQNNN